MSLRLDVDISGKNRPVSPHKGLVLERFIPPKDDPASHKESLAALTRVSSGYEAYQLAYRRWADCGKELPNASCFEGKIRSRMALGLGIESVHEIGCRLHATYGVPVIPGSSLKGALRASLEENEAHHQYADFLFGSQESIGYARIFDAWWIPDGQRSGLSADVITVHHQEYYSKTSHPVDTESPIPVSFLTVTGKFLFTIQGPNESWRRFLEDATKHLLRTRGIGAKRNAGYGRMDV